MASANQVSTENGFPAARPTQAAFRPASKKDIWQGVGIGFVCLFGVAIGFGAWFDPTLLETQTVSTVTGPGWWLTACLPFVFPIFLPIALYFWWDAWRRWRRTRAFERNKQTTTGVITHLWMDPPRPPGKRYYVGYRFGEGQGAFQDVPARTYGRLAVGDEVTVEYAAVNPEFSHLELSKRHQKRTS